MTYNLRNGGRIITRKVDAGTEFETQNANGETISTVVHDYLTARALVITLTKGA